MKTLHFECVSGASGDMILGTLIGLGVNPRDLEHDIAQLPIEHFQIEAQPVTSHHLTGTQVTVHAHEPHHHHGRGLPEIRGMIDLSALPAPVKAASLRVFERIAEAEARVHGTTPEKIHFHEVGALDSIVDIVGCCSGLHRLGVDGVSVSAFPCGHGTIECAHGVFPNPAPATLELLKGFPVVQVDEPFELVTPTGAALLTTWKTLDAPPTGSRIVRAACSFGHRQLNHRPNMLRATLLETAAGASPELAIVLECNIDDTTPELLGSLTQRLLETGALDVFTTAVQMKKQRPGTLLTVLCKPGNKRQMIDLIFHESTTFGVREYTVERTVLARRFAEVQTPYGSIRVKIGTWQGRDTVFAPEMDDCIRRSREHNIPVRAAYEAAAEASAALRKKTPSS